jgi:uncharacterized protein (TIGR02099 family)
MAIVFSMARVITPYLNTHKDQLARWVSRLLDTRITLGNVDLAWQGINPLVKLNDVHFYNPVTNAPIAELNNVQIGVDIIQSLWKKTFEPGTVILSGAKIALWQQDTGTFNLKPDSNTAQALNRAETDQKVKQIVGWLAIQKHIGLDNIELTLHLKHNRSMILDHLAVLLSNQANEHMLAGQFILNKAHPTPIHFAAKITGDFTQPQLNLLSSSSDLLASTRLAGYIKAEQLSLASWLPQDALAPVQFTSGNGDIALWFYWLGSKQQLTAKAEVTLYDLALRNETNHEQYEQPYLNGLLAFYVDPTHWEFSSSDLTLKETAKNKHAFSAYGSMQDGKLSAMKAIWISDLNFHFLARLNKLSLFPKNALTTTIDNIDPSGSLRDIYFSNNVRSIPTAFQAETRRPCAEAECINQYMSSEANGQQSLSLKGEGYDPAWVILAKADHIQTKAWKNFPGVSTLSGTLQATPSQGKLIINSNGTSVDYPALFENPVTFDSVQGALNWTYSEEGWLIDIEKISLTNPVLDLYGNTRFLISAKNQPLTIDSTLGFDIHQVSSLFSFYPSQVMPKSLFNWLSHNIVDGDNITGKLLLRGPIKAFPFPHQEGVFEVEADAKNITLRPDVDWPLISSLNGHIAMNQSRLQINIDDMAVEHSTISNAEAEIADISKPTPFILSFKTKGDADNIKHYLQQSPVAKDLPDLKEVKTSGQVNTSLKITVPLADETPITTEVEASLDNVKLSLSDSLPILAKLKGTLFIRNTDLKTNQMNAVFLDKPATVTLKTENNTLFFNLSGLLTPDALRNYLDEQWLNHAEGQTPFNLQVRVPNASNKPVQARINTNLTGMRIKAPNFLSKTASQSRDSELMFTMNNARLEQVNFHYGQALAGLFILNAPLISPRIAFGHLVFGSDTAAKPANSGITISGHLPDVDLSKWLAYYKERIAQKNKTDSSLPAVKSQEAASFLQQLHYIDLSLDSLAVFQQTLKPVTVKAMLNKDKTTVQLTSPQVKGTVSIPADLVNQPIEGNLDYVHLILPETYLDKTSPFNPTSVPALTMAIKDLSINETTLGNLAVDTQPITNGLLIEQVNLINPYLTLSAEGSWIQIGSGNKTQLKGKISTDNVNAFLTYWKHINDIEGTTANIDFDLAWPNTLFQFKVAAATGTAYLALGPGRIINIGSNSNTQGLDIGRLLNVFSLSSLAKHLRLDFSDLTEKGYSFNSVTGHFKLQEGNVDTSDTLLKGTLADLSLSGRIAILKRSYDLALTVLPHLTSSLPVLATVAGTAALGPLGPVIGAATWVVDKAVLNPGVSKLTSFSYRITGPWDKPQLIPLTPPKEVNRSPSDSSKQPVNAPVQNL